MIINEQPCGILKCLPVQWVERTGGMDYVQRIRQAIDDGRSMWWMSFPTRPRYDVLHLYVVFDGLVQFRVNIVEYRSGHGMTKMYGGTFRANFWALCTGPLVTPISPCPIKGFRGFRYTHKLF